MEENVKSAESEENIPNPEEIRALYPIEDDADTLEPFIDEDEHRKINQNDPSEMAYWEGEFQISESELNDAIILNGNSVKEIKKYLSV